MSTRCIMAYATETGWKGVYHHFDGYPNGIGVYLERMLHQYGLEKMKRIIDEHPKGWIHLFPSKTSQGLIQPQCYCHSPEPDRGGMDDVDGDMIYDDKTYKEEWPVYVMGLKGLRIHIGDRIFHSLERASLYFQNTIFSDSWAFTTELIDPDRLLNDPPPVIV